MNEQIWAEALCNVYAQKKSVQLSRTFVSLLEKKGEIQKLPKIIEQLKRKQAHSLGVVQGTLRLAHPVSLDTQAFIIDQLRKRLGAEHIEWTVAYDDRLVAGGVFETEHSIIDFSLSGLIT